MMESGQGGQGGRAEIFLVYKDQDGMPRLPISLKDHILQTMFSDQLIYKLIDGCN